MSDKSISERIGVAENDISSMKSDIADLQQENANRKSAITRAMWWVIRLLGAVTILTFTTEKAKEKWLPIISGLGL